MNIRSGEIFRFAACVAAVGLASGAGGEMPAEPNAEIVAVTVTEPAAVDPEIAVDPVIDRQQVLPVRLARAGRYDNLFAGHSWYTPPPPEPVRESRPAVRYEPTAPPLPYQLLGTYEQAGSDTLYFLVKGDRVYDVTIGETLDDTYSVDSVTDGQLMFTYLPLNTSQGLRLGEQQ